MTVLMALLIAHLLADFVFQRTTVIQGKRTGRWQAWFEHGAVHLVCMVVAWLLFSPQPILDWQVAAAFGLILATHLPADWVKIRAGGARPLAAFVLDQVFHVLVLVAVAAWLVDSSGWMAEMADFRAEHQARLGVLVVAYLLAVFACGWLNRHLLDSLVPGEQPGADSGLAMAGLRIGWLERFLLLSALLVQAWAALGLVLAAKSVYRFETIRKDGAHAEYFLIGTLVSVAEVVIIGAVLLTIWPLTGGGA